MRYIERVLPSLGETAVALRSLGEVVGGIRATRHDEPAVADVKGATRMAELMRRTSRQHAPGAPTSFRIYWRDVRRISSAIRLAPLTSATAGSSWRVARMPPTTSPSERSATAVSPRLGSTRSM